MSRDHFLKLNDNQPPLVFSPLSGVDITFLKLNTGH